MDVVHEAPPDGAPLHAAGQLVTQECKCLGAAAAMEASRGQRGGSMCGQAAAEKVSTVDSIDERPPLSSTCHCYAHTSRVRLHTVSPRLHLRWQEVNVPLSAPIASLYRMPASSAKHKHTQHTQLRRSAAQLKGPVHPFSLSPSVHRPARVWLACGRLRVQHFARGGGAKALQARGHKAWMHSQLVKHDSLTLLCDTSPPPPQKKKRCATLCLPAPAPQYR